MHPASPHIASPLPPPPSPQIFMSVFQGRYGSYKGAAIFQAILFIASNFCGATLHPASLDGGHPLHQVECCCGRWNGA